MKFTQFPEEPLPEAALEALWFKDDVVRDQKQIYSLN